MTTENPDFQVALIRVLERIADALESTPKGAFGQGTKEATPEEQMQATAISIVNNVEASIRGVPRLTSENKSDVYRGGEAAILCINQAMDDLGKLQEVATGDSVDIVEAACSRVRDLKRSVEKRLVTAVITSNQPLGIGGS